MNNKIKYFVIGLISVSVFWCFKDRGEFLLFNFLQAKTRGIVMFGDVLNMINLYIPDIEFIDKKSNKSNGLKEELSRLKRYVLGIGDENPRDILEIQFGIKKYLSINENTVINNKDKIIDDLSKQNDFLASGEVKITNETDYDIDIEKLLNEPLSKKITKDDKVLVYHTHTNESYISDITKLNDMSISPRSEDENINVVKVGDWLCDNLSKFNFCAMHSKKYHNVPKDKGAYARSFDTVLECMNKEPSIKIIFDIHRDGVSDSKKLREVYRIGDKDIAKIMFVVGTNATGLSHDNWRENLKFAIKLQEKLISYNPNIVKPIYVSKNRYNQHLTNFALIIEIGGDGNVITESIESTKYIARALNDLVED